MADLSTYCSTALEALEAQHLRRRLRITERFEDAGVLMQVDGHPYVSFACNDYLGLRTHPEVVAAGARALAEYGAGAGASRLVTGNHPYYAPLEAQLARMKGTEAALVFGSGYLANLGIIPALVGKGDIIFADKLVHACIIDGALLSGARLIRFRHNDMAHLEQLLKGYRADGKNALIVTDHVFSMDGDIAPIAQIAALGKHYDAWTMADDAHGLGVIDCHPGLVPGSPETGLSAFRETPGQARGDIDLWMGTLSKAAGGYGGYVCASRAVVDYLTTTARSAVFSTGLPPAVCASALAALEIIAREPERGALALSLAQRVTRALGLPPAQSAIVPIILGEAEAALAASEALKSHGILAVAIRPPTVPPGTARLRLAFSCEHSDAQVDALIAALQGV